ncbi:MAG: GNAT family protein [Ignavibacteria bacterium]|jgi:ribosomal-protein-alanine N-acetyltransferase
MTPEKLFLKLPKIETERLILRKLEYSDKRDIFDYSKYPEVSRYLIWKKHETEMDTLEFLDFVMEKYKENQPAPWGIELKEKNKIIGTIGYHEWDKKNFKAEVGYVLHCNYWQNGIMTEALNYVIEFGFTKMYLNRIEARTDPENIPSQKLLEKVGFLKEGLLREQMLVKERFQDFFIYAILRKEYFRK